MLRYRKRPVEVDGQLYTGDNDDEMRAFVGASDHHPVKSEDDPPGSNWAPAVPGVQSAAVWNTSQLSWNDVNPGDTVLRGLLGECYPCSPDALAAGFEQRPSGVVVHFAGPDVAVDALLRQRCAWCGAVLVDYDLRRVAVPVGQDEKTPGTWPVGALVQVDGPMSQLVEPVPGQLPDHACALPDLYQGDDLAARVAG